MNVRALFGAFREISTEPGMSAPCTEIATVPVATWLVSFASAARPPMAARCFSTTSSAVCACTPDAAPARAMAAAAIDARTRFISAS